MRNRSGRQILMPDIQSRNLRVFSTDNRFVVVKTVEVKVDGMRCTYGHAMGN